MRKQQAKPRQRVTAQHIATPRLFDHLMGVLQVKNDAALAKALGIGPPAISKMRNAHLRVSDAMLICMHEASGVSIKELKLLMQYVE